MFIDKVKIRAKAGDGGNGCVSFRREAYVEHGGPDGGQGGKGGDVILMADKNVQDLTDYTYSPRVVAQRGQHGRGKNCSGKSAKDVIVRVPIGTQVFQTGDVVKQLKSSNYRPGAAEEEAIEQPEYDRNTKRRRSRPTVEEKAFSVAADSPSPDGDPAAEERQLIADLVEDGQLFVLAKGGKGGRGNYSFKSSVYQAPREFEFGEPGEELPILLELKTLADVGLVGFPNAGKSTLISKLTNAHPKIASYPFTTKSPKVGVITYDDYKRIRVADIPGLIEGAHAGRGLGHEFLRHIERCALLVIMIDMAGTDAREPLDDYRQLLEELKLHDPALLDKPRLVVANKMDEPVAVENLKKFKRKLARPSRAKKSPALRAAAKLNIIEISALKAEGLDELILAIRNRLE